MKIDEAMSTFVSGHVMIGLATRDWAGQASIARGVGVRVTDNGAGLDILISGRQWRRSVENLAANGALASTFSSPTDYITYQFKGHAELAAAGPADLVLARSYIAGMRARLADLGVPENVAAQWFSDEDLRCARLGIELAFVQTPGPRAGEVLAT
ncbi:pyridoxamine 5'-phosphate oxidase family protein [Tropicimonas sp. IMCC34043]|uniref:pyridoxamine 5'-phosphate oxidase family protein n=1 Tax=Tropicimonas sp. IMCC34043 TaxID=2248760 RepID=UPI000E25CDF5|nr:pyridoxamine 5'-phosphate oxidase family protein [Tropicimonas sp. IMCC34043]